MEKVIIHKVYNLVNCNGDKLLLRLGMLRDTKENGVTVPVVNGWRWSFEGNKIPMPVRSRTWFNGFPIDTMLLWLAENEWYVVTEVDMASGKTKVHGLPEPKEAYHDYQFDNDKMEFNRLIKELCSNGKKLNAMYLYRYAHEVGTRTALKAIDDICAE